MSLRGMPVYIASSFSQGREAAIHARTVLETKGYKSTAGWIDSHLKEDIGPKDRAKEARKDLNDIEKAWVFVLLNHGPLTPGRMIEFGYALATGLEMIIVGPLTSIFHHLPNVQHYESVEDIDARV